MKKDFIILLASSLLILIVFTFSMGKKSNACADACFDQKADGQIDAKEKLATFEGKKLQVPQDVLADSSHTSVLGSVSDNKWIEVDLSEQKIRAWEGGALYLESLVSTGLPGTPTPQGEFRIWMKFRATKMEGGSGRGYYYLPNVPYVMFFENGSVLGWKGYSLHGTYWHNDFGRPKSHGCVNLPTPIAGKLYEWTAPVLSAGKSVRADDANPGTRIVIHE